MTGQEYFETITSAINAILMITYIYYSNIITDISFVEKPWFLMHQSLSENYSCQKNDKEP